MLDDGGGVVCAPGGGCWRGPVIEWQAPAHTHRNTCTAHTRTHSVSWQALNQNRTLRNMVRDVVEQETAAAKER